MINHSATSLPHNAPAAVAARMTPAEFARRAVGVRWAKDRADWQAMNCVGLLVLWHRHVLGIEVEFPPISELTTGHAAVAETWPQCDPLPVETVWIAWRGPRAEHCGVLLSATEVLHAEGGDTRPGAVRVSPLRAMRGLFSDDVRFYRFGGAR